MTGRRVLNVETVDGLGPGFVLDVYESGISAYRAEVRDPEERIIMAVASAKLDGDASVLESVRNFFAGRPDAHVGTALVEGARAELEEGHEHYERRAEVGGLELAGVVMEALSPLLDAHPDIGRDALADVAARAAVELHRRYQITERT